MTKTTRVLPALTALVLAAGLLAGCGQGGASSSSSSAPAAASSAPASSASIPTLSLPSTETPGAAPTMDQLWDSLTGDRLWIPADETDWEDPSSGFSKPVYAFATRADGTYTLSQYSAYGSGGVTWVFARAEEAGGSYTLRAEQMEAEGGNTLYLNECGPVFTLDFTGADTVTITREAPPVHRTFIVSELPMYEMVGGYYEARPLGEGEEGRLAEADEYGEVHLNERESLLAEQSTPARDYKAVTQEELDALVR